MTTATNASPAAEITARDDEHLLPHHRELLHDRAIPDAVIKRRGYYSTESRTHLRDLGFSDTQAKLADAGPVLVIPLWSISGKPDGHQIRPDVPRADANDKARKYENLPNHGTRFDVSPAGVNPIDDITCDIYITESPMKADALATAGAVCAMGMPGVWGWKGADAVAAIDTITWKRRTARLVPDSDVKSNHKVREAIWRLGNRLSRGESTTVHFYELPDAPDGSKQGVDDWLARGAKLRDLDALKADLTRFSKPTEKNGRTLAKIIVGQKQLRDAAAEAVNALVADNDPPSLFIRSGEPVRVRDDEHGRPVIGDVNEGVMRKALADAADWIRIGKDGEQPTSPPRDLIQTVLAWGTLPLPPLKGIIEAPGLRDDGSVIEVVGYDRASSLIYRPAEGLSVPAVPAVPSSEDVRKARSILIDELLCDFPFEAQSDRANAIAGILTPYVRNLIHGPTPLFAIDKPVKGTGGGLLMAAISLAATGRLASGLMMSTDESEMRKAVTASLSQGPAVIAFDNVDTVIKSASLSAALTGHTWADRVLGVGRVDEYPIRCLWLLNGNKLRFGGDVSRRVVPINIVRSIEDPYDIPPENFKHPELMTWATENRAALVWACLVLCRSWLAAGRPDHKIRPFGSYESWSHVLAGILGHAGIPGLIDNLPDFRAVADEVSDKWGLFFERWHAEFGEQGITTEALADAIDVPHWREVIPSLPGNPEKQTFIWRLGRGLSQHVKEVHDGYQLRRMPKRTKSKKESTGWQVVLVAVGGDTPPNLNSEGGIGGYLPSPAREGAQAHIRTSPAHVQGETCPPIPPIPPDLNSNRVDSGRGYPPVGREVLD